MSDQPFAVDDRVRHRQLGQTGKIILIYSKVLPGVPIKTAKVYRIQFDNLPSTIDALAHELEPLQDLTRE